MPKQGQGVAVQLAGPLCTGWGEPANTPAASWRKSVPYVWDPLGGWSYII